jgi:hypothetical protein
VSESKKSGLQGREFGVADGVSCSAPFPHRKGLGLTGALKILGFIKKFIVGNLPFFVKPYPISRPLRSWVFPWFYNPFLDTQPAFS